MKKKKEKKLPIFQKWLVVEQNRGKFEVQG